MPASPCAAVDRPAKNERHRPVEATAWTAPEETGEAHALVTLSVGSARARVALLATRRHGAERSPPTAAGWSAGPVARWARLRSGGSQRVREVQRTLRGLDYRPGPVDGLFGPLTERAVVRFQRAEALAADGIVGPRTLRRLRAASAAGTRPATRAPTQRRRPPHRPAPVDATRRPPRRRLRRGARTAAGDPRPRPRILVLVALLGLLVALLGLLVFAGALASRQAPRSRRRRTRRRRRPARPAAAGPAGPPRSPRRRTPTAAAGPRLGELLRGAGALSRRS